MRKAQSLVEFSAWMMFFAIVIMLMLNLIEESAAKARELHSLSEYYSGRLVGAYGNSQEWGCVGASGLWEGGYLAKYNVVLTSGSQHIAASPTAYCKNSSLSRPGKTCANYYWNSARVFSLPCSSYHGKVSIFAPSESVGQFAVVSDVVSENVLRIVLETQHSGVIYRHSVLVAIPEE